MSGASSAAPAVVRSHSSSRRQSSYTTSLADRPHRTQSSATKAPSTPTGPTRSASHSYSHNRTPSPSQQAQLGTIARRDYETTNVARPPSSRRSSSRDRSSWAPAPPTRTESTRSTRRNSSRGHSRYNSDMGPNGGPTSVPPPGTLRTTSDAPVPGSSGSNKRRTTITAQTGQWSLGKTIGAGSMGKVKLAKNLETGEQVGNHICPRLFLTDKDTLLNIRCLLRLLSRLSHDCRPTSTIATGNANEQINPRRSEPHGKQPLSHCSIIHMFAQCETLSELTTIGTCSSST